MYAIDGFESLDYKLNPFTAIDYKLKGQDFIRNYTPGDVVVGCLSTMRSHFLSINSLPPAMDYPSTIGKELSGRNATQTTLFHAGAWFSLHKNIFIKPVQSKLSGFKAKPYNELEHEALLFDFQPETPVWISEHEEYCAEYRIFVHKGKIQDVRRYRSCHWTPDQLDTLKIEAMVDAYDDAPVAYTLDVAVTSAGRTVLVEVNDFWAVGSYGLAPETYATMLKDRYTQILVRRR